MTATDTVRDTQTSEITLTVERDSESGWLLAWWDAPGGGGITTQGRDLRELQDNVREAVACHFEPGQAPRSVRLHFATDPVLACA